jgi:hypothetical protein
MYSYEHRYNKLQSRDAQASKPRRASGSSGIAAGG